MMAGELIYVGPKVVVFKGLKRFSIASCIITCIGAPLLIFKMGKGTDVKSSTENGLSQSLVHRYSSEILLSLFAVSMNIGSTLICQHLLRRYVLSIRALGNAGLLEIEKMKIFGSGKVTQVHRSELIPTVGVLAQWKHRTSGEKYLVDIGSDKFGEENEEFSKLVEYINRQTQFAH